MMNKTSFKGLPNIILNLKGYIDENGRTGRLIINYELIKNNLPPVVITKEDRVKYFEFLRNKDVEDFAKWLEELSYKEKRHSKIYKKPLT